MARSLSRRKRDRSSSRSRSSSRTSSSTSSSSSSSSPSSSSDSTRSSSSSASSSSSSSSASRSPPSVKKVQVNRLTKNLNKNHLLEIFKNYGPVKSIDLPMDRHHPHLGRGSAFIEFEKSEDADKAIRYMDGGQIDGQEITVSKVNGKPIQRRRGDGNGSRR